MPCSIRDHYKNFRENIITDNAKPEDKQAEKALKDHDYFNTMVRYDNELELLTEEITKKDNRILHDDRKLKSNRINLEYQKL